MFFHGAKWAGAVYGDELTALLLPKNLDRSLAHLEPQHFAQVRARRASFGQIQRCFGLIIKV